MVSLFMPYFKGVPIVDKKKRPLILRVALVSAKPILLLNYNTDDGHRVELIHRLNPHGHATLYLL